MKTCNQMQVKHFVREAFIKQSPNGDKLKKHQEHLVTDLHLLQKEKNTECYTSLH